MRIAEKKLTTESANNRISLSKNIVINRNSGNRSSSVSNNTYFSYLNQNKDNNVNNLSNSVKQPIKYNFYLGRGNNQNLVRKILVERGCWFESTDSTSTFINFKWQQDQKGYKYNRLQDSGQYRSVLNHFQFHQCLSNKENLFRNLEAYCNKFQQDIWTIVPPTFILNIKDQCSLQKLKGFSEYFQKYYPKKMKDKFPQYEKNIQESKRKLKHYFFNSNEKKNQSKLPSMPNVFINQEEGDYLWIMKPTFLNRGRGIQIFSDLTQLYNYVSQNVNGYIQKSLNIDSKNKQQKFVDYIKKNSEQVKVINRVQEENRFKKKNISENRQSTCFDGNQFIRVIPRAPVIIKTECFLIQKYLERPLLILNHKFDIRMWVLVTHNLSFFVFKQGYIRLSSLQYKCQYGQNNTSMHLTNNAVQKFTPEYGKIAEGNQMSFSQLKKMMEEKNLNWDQCLLTIHKHMQKSLAAAHSKLNPLNRRFIFEIFGYDFMIDESGYPWLIEVNNNPCIQQSSQMLSKLLHRMLDDGFKLTLDVIFPGSTSTTRYPVQGYRDNENMWKPLRTLN